MFILPDVFRDELCAGFEYRVVAKRLRELGYLQCDHGKYTKNERLAELGQTRCYKFRMPQSENEKKASTSSTTGNTGNSDNTANAN